MIFSSKLMILCLSIILIKLSVGPSWSTSSNKATSSKLKMETIEDQVIEAKGKGNKLKHHVPRYSVSKS